jgi:small-conductance mechanosensitive channel
MVSIAIDPHRLSFIGRADAPASPNPRSANCVEVSRAVPPANPAPRSSSLPVHVVEGIKELLRLHADWQAQLVATGVLVLVLLSVRNLIIRILNRRVPDLTVRYYTQKLITYATTVVGFLLLFPIWIKNASTLGTSVALVSAGLAIALSDVVKDLAGWLFIIIRRPFHIGDRITIGDHTGDVIDVMTFDFILFEIRARVDGDDPTGRTVRIPNGHIFSKPLVNFSAEFEFMWQEVAALITFESDWRRGREVILEIMRDHSDEELHDIAAVQINDAEAAIHVEDGGLQPTVYVRVLESGVLLTGRHLVRVRETRRMEDKVWQSILTAFEKEEGLEFAYPTVRTYLRDPIALNDGRDRDRASRLVDEPRT